MRFLLLLFLSLLSTASLYADNTRVWGWCEKGGQIVVGPGANQSTSKVQASYPGCTVTVFIAGGSTPTTIYNQDGTELSNPFTASATTGYWFFYVPDGRYDVQLSGAGFTSPFTLGDISVGGSGGGGSGCGVDTTCTIPQGGTSATTAPAATHNLQFIAGTSPTPATGAVAVPDDAALNLHISVTYFNADTGLSDNSTAFNNTIQYLLSRGGGEAFIPCGTYNFTNPITIDHQPLSLVGESEHCVVLNYTGTGTFLNIVDTPPTGGPHGEYRNFTVTLPNGTSSTIGMLSSTSNALYENIQTTGCSAATAYFVSNGVIQAPVSPSYEERNTWINVNDDHCGKGWEIGSTGTPPTDNFIDYNYFDNISGQASMGQVVFQLDSGPWFMHNYVHLACKIDNVTTISTSSPVACIKSNGRWNINSTYLNGEWNNSIGSGTGPDYSVWVTAGAQFTNTGGYINVFTIPGGGGAQVPFENEAGTGSGAPFVTVHQQFQPDWDTGTYFLGGNPTTPWTGFRDQGPGTLGVLEGTNLNSPYVTMNSATGNKFVIGVLPSGSPIGSMTDVADVDTNGNLFLKGSTLSINGLSWLWPTAYSVGCLYDDGSGNITHSGCSGGGGGGGLNPPVAPNGLIYYLSGLDTRLATSADVLTTLADKLDVADGLPTLDSSGLLQRSEVPASSSAQFGGILDFACPSGDHVFSMTAGVTTCTPDSGGGGGTPTLNSILAATASNSINNGDNQQTWNFSLTTANNIGFHVSENVASTASGSSLVWLNTLVGSVAKPLCVTAQGTSNGVCVGTDGILTKIGTGGIDAGALVNTVPTGALPVLGLQTVAEVATCSNGIPGSILNLPSTNFPTPSCPSVSTSYPYGTLDYGPSANTFAFAYLTIPTGTQTEDMDFYWSSSSSSQTIKWTIATACIGPANDVLNPTFNTAQTISSTSAAANQLTIATQIGVTLTGCSDHDEEIVKIGRDVTDGSSATASLRGILPIIHQHVSN